MGKNNTPNFKDGQKITWDDVAEYDMSVISPEQFKELDNKYRKEYEDFVNTEEWMKHIEWKKSLLYYAVTEGPVDDNSKPEYVFRKIWKYTCKLADIIHVQANLDALFKYHPVLGAFKYNEFRKKKEWNGKEYDEDTMPAEIFNWFKRNFNEWCPRTDIKEAIQERLNYNIYNPVKDWIESHDWDGVPRIEEFMIKHYGAEDTKLTRTYFKRWMIGMIKRIWQPGCQFDSMLILAGEQGKKKTTFFRWLGDLGHEEPYCNDVPADLKDTNNLIYATKGNYVMVFDDFDDICQKDGIGKIKSFITFRGMKGALKWQHEKSFMVSYVLGASTNRFDMLVDDGSFDERRFWIIEVKPESEIFDIPDYEKEQLFAEALYLYKEDTDQRLWIWEKELKDEEIELQKKYKRAGTDNTTDIILDIFERKYPIKDGMFESYDQFTKDIVDPNIKYMTEDSAFMNGYPFVYIDIIPTRWLINYIKNLGPRSTDRILQILHVNGYKVEKKERYNYKGRRQTCIHIISRPEPSIYKYGQTN